MTGIGLTSLTLLTGEHFGTVAIIACFQDLGTNPFLTETLIILVKTGEIWKAKYLKNQNGMLSHPREVRLILESKAVIYSLIEFCKIFSF